MFRRRGALFEKGRGVHYNSNNLRIVYRFCQGCPIDCDDHPIGSKVALIGIDWDTATLNLKYQQALERVCILLQR